VNTAHGTYFSVMTMCMAIYYFTISNSLNTSNMPEGF
jgi:hypothetical protein